MSFKAMRYAALAATFAGSDSSCADQPTIGAGVVERRVWVGRHGAGTGGSSAGGGRRVSVDARVGGATAGGGQLASLSARVARLPAVVAATASTLASAAQALARWTSGARHPGVSGGATTGRPRPWVWRRLPAAAGCRRWSGLSVGYARAMVRPASTPVSAVRLRPRRHKCRRWWFVGRIRQGPWFGPHLPWVSVGAFRPRRHKCRRRYRWFVGRWRQAGGGDRGPARQTEKGFGPAASLRGRFAMGGTDEILRLNRAGRNECKPPMAQSCVRAARQPEARRELAASAVRRDRVPALRRGQALRAETVAWTARWYVAQRTSNGHSRRPVDLD